MSYLSKMIPGYFCSIRYFNTIFIYFTAYIKLYSIIVNTIIFSSKCVVLYYSLSIIFKIQWCFYSSGSCFKFTISNCKCSVSAHCKRSTVSEIKPWYCYIISKDCVLCSCYYNWAWSRSYCLVYLCIFYSCFKGLIIYIFSLSVYLCYRFCRWFRRLCRSWIIKRYVRNIIIVHNFASVPNIILLRVIWSNNCFICSIF